MKRSQLALTVALAAGLIAAVGYAPDHAAAAFPGANGLIAFTSVDDPSDGHPPSVDIYAMPVDGSSLTRLTDNAVHNRAPAWSPDGQQLAFVSFPDGGAHEIYVMNADGSGQTRLTNNPALDFAPAWSPDGQKLAFTSARDGNFEIYVMNADGSSLMRLTDNAASDGWPAWSPDGQKLAFTSARDGNFETYVMNADGSGQTRLTNNGAGDAAPTWSPDGQKLAFASDDAEIYVMNADGSGQTRLTDNAVYDSEPAWSPDGQNIAFTTGGRDGDGLDFEIYLMNADGSGQTPLTNNVHDDSDPDWQTLVPPADSDGDGIPDAKDVETTQDAVAELPASAFKGGDPGVARAIYNALEDVEAAVAVGDNALALDRLDALHKRVDGCVETADRTDWITDCVEQPRIRALIDDLITNLSN